MQTDSLPNCHQFQSFINSVFIALNCLCLSDCMDSILYFYPFQTMHISSVTL
nr:MAG TPA: hypothetical protein [Caudoviricetes sp.]